MKPASSDARPYLPPSLVQTVAPSSATSGGSLTSSPSMATGLLPQQRPAAPVLGQVVPLARRKREFLDSETAAATAQRGDATRFVEAFRANLRSASMLPEGALTGLVRNLVADRAGGLPLAQGELHLLLDVLVAERDTLTRDAACQIVRGLVGGLGGAALHRLHLGVLVDRLVCMGFGDPGRSIRDELQALTTAVTQGPNRRQRLGWLVERALTAGTGLKQDRLDEAVAGIAQGLRQASAHPDRMDADLHQCMLERILRPEAERSTVHVRCALLALWENLATAGLLTEQLRNQVLNQVFACRPAAGPRLMRSACSVLAHFLSKLDDAPRHHTALFATLVRESFWMSAEDIREAALGLVAGLGGHSMQPATRDWLEGEVKRWQAIHPEADWDSLFAGHIPRPAGAVEDVSKAHVQHEAEAAGFSQLWIASDAAPRPESKHASELQRALETEQAVSDGLLRWRGRTDRARQSLVPISNGHRVEDLVPPSQQPRLREMIAGMGMGMGMGMAKAKGALPDA